MLILSIVTPAIALAVFLALRDLRPCGRTYGTLVRCSALVGRRGHTFHLWEPLPLGPVMRSWVGDIYDRNLRAIMAEERIAMSVRRPENLVRIVTTP